MRTLYGAAIAAATILTSVACSSPGRVAAWEKDGMAADGTTTSTSAGAQMHDEALALFAQRDDKAKLEQAIAKWEQVVEKNPRHAEALTMLSRANYFLADGYLALESGQTEVEMKTYEKGADYGERALIVLEPKFEQAMRAEQKFETAIGGISKKGIPAAYWYAVNLGRFASKQGLSARLYYKDKLAATMQRILDLDEQFFYGAAHRYFGAFYSILPGIAGKDLTKSAMHFSKSLEIAPEYLGTKVVKAQFLAVELDDEDMYRALLQEVLAGEDTDNGDIAPENRAAKRTAKKMLDNADEIF